MKKITTTVLIAAFLMISNSCNSKHAADTESTNTQSKEISKEKNYWVKNSGSRLKIIQEGDFSATISLDSLIDKPNLFAIGPLEGLKGELTVYNGEVSIATLENNEPKFTSKVSETNTIFMVYGSSTKWKKITIEKALNG